MPGSGEGDPSDILNLPWLRRQDSLALGAQPGAQATGPADARWVLQLSVNEVQMECTRHTGMAARANHWVSPRTGMPSRATDHA